MTIDYTKAIRAHADWDKTLSWPARVVKRREDGYYLVAIDAEHVTNEGGLSWPSGETWAFSADGNLGDYDDRPYLHLRNVEEKPKELVAWEDVEQWAKDKAARKFKYKGWSHLTENLTASPIAIGQELARYIATYEKPEPDRALIVAREYFASGYDEGSTPAAIMRGEWDDRDCITGFVAGYNQATKDAQG